MFSRLFPPHFRPACLQRGGGLAKAGGTLSVIRTTNGQFPTKSYEKLHPRLRQTACCAAGIFVTFVCM